MFRNYFKTTFRHILKNKVNFFFRLGGLTLAFSGLVIIALYVSYHLSFDRYHEDYQKIYRVNSEWVENGTLASYAIVPQAIGPALKEAFPEIRSFARLGHSSSYLVRYKDQPHRVHGFVSADSTVFDILKFRFVRGDKHALDHPGSIVLTRSLAEQLFGDEDPMDKAITFVDRANQVLEVTAIIEDLPPNSHLHIRALIPSGALTDAGDLPVDPWEISIDGSVNLYVRFYQSVETAAFVSKAVPVLRANLKSREDDLEKSYSINLQPIGDIHLDPWIYADLTKKANVIYVYVFSLLGLFLLLIAGINYINLSIADFHRRSKELGIRKVLGARRGTIALQVLLETCILCVVAAMASLVIVYMIFPEVVQVLESDLRFDMLLDPRLSWVIGAVVLLLVFVSAIYPAWHLSVKKPVNEMKSVGVIANNSAGNVLLFIQFAISVICISSTLSVGEQIRFFQTKDPGYTRENTMVLYMPDRYPPEKIPVIKDELGRIQGVDAVSYSTFRIVGGYYRDWYRVEVNGAMKQVLLNEVFFDHDFFRTMGIELVAGRSFDPNNVADAHSAFIVNEAAVREFGWENPIGKRISYGYEETEGEKWEGAIVGVVKDFNVYSMHRKIEPLVMRLPWSDWPGSCVHIKISGPIHETIARIEEKYHQILPDFLIDYHLIGELYDNQYQNERKAHASLKFGTWIIVLISCLGIFSLSVYMSIRRMKEFGIRKVLGATVHQIAFLHVSHFLKIAIVANIFSLPVSYLLMEKWLSEFAYRTELSALIFAGVTGISFLLVIVSAGYASVKAGVMNPVDVIRSEN